MEVSRRCAPNCPLSHHTPAGPGPTLRAWVCVSVCSLLFVALFLRYLERLRLHLRFDVLHGPPVALEAVGELVADEVGHARRGRDARHGEGARLVQAEHLLVAAGGGQQAEEEEQQQGEEMRELREEGLRAAVVL